MLAMNHMFKQPNASKVPNETRGIISTTEKQILRGFATPSHSSLFCSQLLLLRNGPVPTTSLRQTLLDVRVSNWSHVKTAGRMESTQRNPRSRKCNGAAESIGLCYAFFFFFPRFAFSYCSRAVAMFVLPLLTEPHRT